MNTPVNQSKFHLWLIPTKLPIKFWKIIFFIFTDADNADIQSSNTFLLICDMFIGMYLKKKKAVVQSKNTVCESIKHNKYCH